MPTVLVVDDAPQIRDLYLEILESRGYNVITAEDGEEGLAKIKAELDKPLKHRTTIDAIITDYRMPGL